MNRLIAVLLVSSVAFGNAFASTPDQDAYVDSVKQWRDRAEQGLKRDNGWLTLAGRFQIKPGANTFGTGSDNDIVFPPELKGTGPSRLGTIVVDKDAGRVTLKLADGVSMASDGKPFNGERAMGVSTEKRDWITMGRIAMHIIQREDRFILRLADNESLVRKNFPGRIWYPVGQKYNVDAKFTAYPPGRKIPIVNVIDEVSDEPCPGFVEFKLNGVKHKLDVVGDDADGMFFVMRDGTSGKTTYRPSRFLYVKNKPKAGETFKLDFNQAYNPPCAFSEFTTCPLPPEQNILKVPIEAGEKYRKLG
jgi:uncharacterized protein (DUF1684 family)